MEGVGEGTCRPTPESYRHGCSHATNKGQQPRSRPSIPSLRLSIPHADQQYALEKTTQTGFSAAPKEPLWPWALA
jgi:hypothetical protein